MARTVAATPEQDRQEAERLVATLTLPPEIQHVTVESGFDSTGEEALWVKNLVRRELAFNQQVADRLNTFAATVQRTLLDESFSSYPYTTLDQAA